MDAIMYSPPESPTGFLSATSPIKFSDFLYGFSPVEEARINFDEYRHISAELPLFHDTVNQADDQLPELYTSISPALLVNAERSSQTKFGEALLHDFYENNATASNIPNNITSNLPIPLQLPGTFPDVSASGGETSHPEAQPCGAEVSADINWLDYLDAFGMDQTFDLGQPIEPSIQDCNQSLVDPFPNPLKPNPHVSSEFGGYAELLDSSPAFRDDAYTGGSEFLASQNILSRSSYDHLDDVYPPININSMPPQPYGPGYARDHRLFPKPYSQNEATEYHMNMALQRNIIDNNNFDSENQMFAFNTAPEAAPELETPQSHQAGSSLVRYGVPKPNTSVTFGVNLQGGIDNSKSSRDGKKAPKMPYPEKLPQPAPWGCDFDGTKLFKYTSEGRLEEHRLYSTAEIRQYLSQTRDGKPRAVVWVQNTPAQFNCRLALSDRKCRWEHCPAANKTIGNGWLRVAFDECAEKSERDLIDPFVNAAVMHLWCLEQCVDTAALQPGQLKPDFRTLSNENRNPMSLARDHAKSTVAETFSSWFRSSAATKGGTEMPRQHEDTLSFSLISLHLNLQTNTRERTRKKRNRDKTRNAPRNDIVGHMGDLSVCVARNIKSSKRDSSPQSNNKRKPRIMAKLQSKPSPYVAQSYRDSATTSADASQLTTGLKRRMSDGGGDGGDENPAKRAQLANFGGDNLFDNDYYAYNTQDMKLPLLTQGNFVFPNPGESVEPKKEEETSCSLSAFPGFHFLNKS